MLCKNVKTELTLKCKVVTNEMDCRHFIRIVTTVDRLVPFSLNNMRI